ncbi:MAG: radical SAM protein [Armatimonadota bacterium]
MNRRIEFVYPNDTYPVSLTGRDCSLNCKHCGKYYLSFMKTMEDISSIKDKKSFLISGGSDKKGRVPIKKHLEFLRDLKKQGYRLNLHTGLIDKSLLDDIKPIADSVSFDFLTDKETINEVYSLDVNPAKYYELLESMLSKGINAVPHVTIGIHGGKIKGEYDAIRALKDLPCREVILIIFMPTKGTFYEDRAPVPVMEVSKLFYYARKSLSNKRVTLGCMRPRGNYRYLTDISAINNYFDKVVMPHPKAREHAKERKMDIVEKYECCAIV